MRAIERSDVSPVWAVPHATGRVFRGAWTLVRRFPSRIGSPMRTAVLRCAGARVAGGVTIAAGVRVLGPSGLVIDERVGIARDVLLDARAGVHLESDALVGFEAMLLTWTHRSEKRKTPIAEQGFTGASLTIGARSWIGARSLLLPGASVGANAIVGAGAVVTRPVPSTTVVAGNPARYVRDR